MKRTASFLTTVLCLVATVVATDDSCHTANQACTSGEECCIGLLCLTVVAGDGLQGVCGDISGVARPTTIPACTKQKGETCTTQFACCGGTICVDVGEGEKKCGDPEDSPVANSQSASPTLPTSTVEAVTTPTAPTTTVDTSTSEAGPTTTKDIWACREVGEFCNGFNGYLKPCCAGLSCVRNSINSGRSICVDMGIGGPRSTTSTTTTTTTTTTQAATTATDAASTTTTGTDLFGPP